MEFDPAYGFLYAGVDGGSYVAKIDLLSGAVTNITLTQPVSVLALGPAGKLFIQLPNGAWWDKTFVLVDGVSNHVAATYTGQYEGYLAYDFVHNQLLKGQMNISNGPLYRFDFNGTTNALSLAQTVTMSNSADGVALSGDGNHFAVACGANVVDYNSTDLNYTYGNWPGKVRVQAGDFNKTSTAFLTAGNVNPVLNVYDVNTHALQKSVTAGYSDSFIRVGFSGGGGLIMGLLGAYYGDGTKIYWYKYP